MDAHEDRELAAIAEELRIGDRLLTRRLTRHRCGVCGLGVRHRWLRPALVVLGVVAVTLAGLALLVSGYAGGGGPVCIGIGTATLVAVPFTPLLVDRRRRADHALRSPTEPRPGTAP